MLACPVCASREIEPFLDLGRVPVFCNIQWPTKAQAIAALTASLSLTACKSCSHVFNGHVDEALLAYSPGYDNTQHFSTTFRAYAERLVDRLIGTYGVRGTAVVDIGCGRGDLLHMLAEHGGNRGYGFDPSFAGAAAEQRANVEISRELFNRDHARGLAPALVCCRHVLEHVTSPIEFLVGLREAVSACGDAVLYLEVPSGDQLLRDTAVWDYIYEHVSYFSRESLERCVRLAGFELLSISEDFGGQFLCADVRVRQRNGAADVPRSTRGDDIGAAADRMRAKLQHWRNWAVELRPSDRRASVWGTGSKGVMFLNLIARDVADRIPFAIDQNPNKHGQFVAGTGQQVVAPETASSSGLDQIVVMNPIYRREILERLGALGTSVDVLTA
jgi:SAM-dependent methyltransferase